MSHQALARKYRPRRFAEATGQEHVSETLRRAVTGDRVAHAYLFCGPRGVGKTTLARVLAMALNCPVRARGETEEGEPCGTCESCARIWGGHTALDVVEIDAASNRGVDDARDLRERAMYAPSEEGRFKVYIVDEAHMLTREAWNALLKILEEPPPRVIFVFATTEPQKIQQSAAPILSRCQRFDFRRIGVADIVERLGSVLDAEGAGAPEEALRLIARKADGGMRDGLSLMDQVLSLTGGQVDLEAVRQVLGLVEEERYLELLDILADGRHGEVFRFVERLLDDGYDLVEFYQGLVDVLRALLRIRLSGAGDAAEMSEELRELLAERAGRFLPGDLVRMLAMASELESTGSLRRSAQPRLLLEMLLLRLSYLDRTVELEELIRALGGSGSGGRGAGAGRAASGGPEEPAAAGGVEARQAGPAASPAAPPPSRDSRAADAPVAGEGPSSGPAGPVSLDGAWRRLLSSGAGLPPGMTVPLRAATVSEAEPGAVVLGLPPGPALDRLAGEASLRRELAEALSQALGRDVGIAVEVRGGGSAASAPARITQDSVREGRLRELVEQEPLLGRAVKELDLELLE